ncbi:HD domain-containing protein [Ruminococcus sp. Marseille-P6503]|uniref:HD domain-containing protein n=1 Tax=Ruminococcus sp. Marseille-P6503 TaxID=2364796 RepID=UPI000F52288C|nr:HD domain-containing protein [Ruminococcus sp. Marseille-P6503]
MDEISKLIIKMTEFFRGDPKRIQHFIKVYTFSGVIGRAEGLDVNIMYRLEAAAVIHDIGIKPVEEKYGKGSCGGKLQQDLGPEPAEKMLRELDFDKDVIDRVCFLIAHHHTYTGVKGLDWQILLEADFLVNAYEDELSKESIRSFRDKVFVTETGIRMLNEMFGL